MDVNQTTTPAPRLPVEMDVEFRRSYGRQTEKAKLVNISLTGAFLQAPSQALLPNDKVFVTFTVSGRVRKIQASVVWKNEIGCGVKFHPFNNRDIQIVDDLMYFAESKRQSKRSVLDDIFKHVS